MDVLSLGSVILYYIGASEMRPDKRGGLIRKGQLYFESKCVSFILPASILDLMLTFLFHLDIESRSNCTLP